MQVTIRGQVLQATPSQDQVLDSLIRQQESAKRISFCRICEGKGRREIVREDLRPKFPLNTRYLRDAHYEAEATYKSAQETLDDPSKVVFGGRKWFYERQKGKISQREWRRRRNRQWNENGGEAKKIVPFSTLHFASFRQASVSVARYRDLAPDDHGRRDLWRAIRTEGLERGRRQVQSS